MRNVAIVVVVIVVLLVIALVVLAGRRNKRRAALRERFGPEYDVAVKRGKDRRAVEQRLEALAEQRDRLDIREVERTEHERLGRDWESAQARFVDDPGQAVADADGLVNSVLRSRGYPMEGFDDRAALVATDHQDVVEGYRSAHDTYAAHLQGGSADTEQLRKAFLDYREVFGRLNVPAGREPDGDVPPALEALPAGQDRAIDEGPPLREVTAAPSDGEAAVRPEQARTQATSAPSDGEAAVRPEQPVAALPRTDPPRPEPTGDERATQEPAPVDDTADEPRVAARRVEP